MPNERTDTSNITSISSEIGSDPNEASNTKSTDSSCNNDNDSVNSPNKRRRLATTTTCSSDDSPAAVVAVNETNKYDGTGDNDTSNSPQTVVDDIPAPPYGSKDYWDQRYLKHSQIQNQNELLNENSKNAEDERCTKLQHKSKTEDYDSESSLPYHSWYFTYDELKPIVLPLLLGGRDEEMDDSDDDEDEDVEDQEDDSESVSKEETANEIAEEKDISSKGVVENAVDEVANVDVPENAEEIEKSNNQQNDDGLASTGPVRILEIGCGDVPLGVGLFNDLHALEDRTGAALANVVSQILCTDYSQVVIDKMKKQYSNCSSIETDNLKEATTAVPAETKTENDNAQNSVLEFEAADARNMNLQKYPNGSFQMILEKGLLDAMLSDDADGVQNCIQTVAECARLLTPRTKTVCRLDSVCVEVTPKLTTTSQDDDDAQMGCLIICSHLNAHTQNGLNWLEEIVVAGLLHGTSEYDDPDRIGWKIEVHGNSKGESKSSHSDEEDEHVKGDNVAMDDQNDGDKGTTNDNDANDDEDDDENNLGPAVYVIHKFLKKGPKIAPQLANEADSNDVSVAPGPWHSTALNVKITTDNVAQSVRHGGVGNRKSTVPIRFLSYDE
jgi:hypothetical protein